jgi:hypothetical protein
MAIKLIQFFLHEKSGSGIRLTKEDPVQKGQQWLYAI